MKNIQPFPDRRAIEAEAYDWLIRLDRDEPPTKQELDELREWLARSPVHQQELGKLNAFWGNNILTELMVPLGKHGTHAFSNRFRQYGAIAATIAIGLFAYIFSNWFSVDPLTETNGLYLTAVGQQQTLSLADGSNVEINTNSQIEVDYNDRYRNVRLLQGEVHFHVAENSERPFRVYAGGSRLQAIGTAFTVYLNKAGVNVLVTEGRVALAALGAASSASTAAKTDTVDDEVKVDPYVNSHSKELGVIRAGQSIALDVVDNALDSRRMLTDSIEEVEDNELLRRQSWRDGMLVFTGEPLEQVVREVSRYTTISIEIVDPEIRELQIGGRFKVGRIDEMFVALETNFGLQVNWLNVNRVRLTTAQ